MGKMTDIEYQERKKNAALKSLKKDSQFSATVSQPRVSGREGAWGPISRANRALGPQGP